MATNNRFAVFTDPEDAAAAATKQVQEKKAAPKEQKRVVDKQKETPAAAGEDELIRVGDKSTQQRGGRGGRGGDRGGRGGRGGDREGGRGGRGGRGGDRGGRGGRGRGDRPRTAVAGGEGEEGQVDRPKTGGRGERRHREYTGKAREEAHPYDRKSGTGAGKKDVKKGGHGKGNWGTEKKDGETEQKPAEEEVKREEPVEEEEVVEYEEVGVSLDDFLAQKKANSKGMLATAAGRTHEKANTKGTETGTDKKRIGGIETSLKSDQVYAPSAEGA